jgi:hypothetical protein
MTRKLPTGSVWIVTRPPVTDAVLAQWNVLERIGPSCAT